MPVLHNAFENDYLYINNYCNVTLKFLWKVLRQLLIVNFKPSPYTYEVCKGTLKCVKVLFSPRLKIFALH